MHIYGKHFYKQQNRLVLTLEQLHNLNRQIQQMARNDDFRLL